MAKGPAWLKNAVFYQIYPQSFNDSNDDGIGDLPGIIEKLDYIASLGCNALWINPCFESPFLDAGYDVADYYKVAARYGSNADLKRLFKEAHQRGMRVCLDLVAGHTSVDCEWFQESARHEKNAYSDWYIWTSDWLHPAGMVGDQILNSVNGYSSRRGSYITNFFWSQPALNYGFAKPDAKKVWQQSVDAPGPKAVREEMKKIMRYWLDLGADGFRVDMASSLVKGDTNWKHTSDFWQDVRAMLDKDYPEAVIISEWSYPSAALKAGFHMDFLIHCHIKGYTSLFRQESGTNVEPCEGDSFFRKAGKGDIRIFIDEYLEHYRKTKNKGYMSIPTGNHDLPRISYGRTTQELELMFAFVLTMPGVPFIYYGDEIGMAYQDQLPSHEGGYNRTGARTPMQWNSKKNAGFSSAGKKALYLPVDEGAKAPTVAEQEKDPNSLLNNVRALTALRQDIDVLASDGAFEVLYAKRHQYPLVYQRGKGRERYVIALNPSGRPSEASVTLTQPAAEAQELANVGVTCELQKNKLHLSMKGVSYAIIKV